MRKAIALLRFTKSRLCEVLKRLRWYEVVMRTAIASYRLSPVSLPSSWYECGDAHGYRTHPDSVQFGGTANEFVHDILVSRLRQEMW